MALVKPVYACTLIEGTKLPEGCNLNPDCSCTFEDGSTIGASEWEIYSNQPDTMAKDLPLPQANLTPWVVITVLIVACLILVKKFILKKRK